jgi:hypothetical protein
MADIDIQRKRGPGIWPWILGIAVLALVVWGVIEMTGNDRTAADPMDPAAPAAEQPATDPQWTQPQYQDPATDPQMTDPQLRDPAVDPQTDPATGQPQGTPGAPGTRAPGTGTDTGAGTGY